MCERNEPRALKSLRECFFGQLCGLAMVGVAVWILIAPDVEDIESVSADASNSDLLRVAAILLIVVGGLLFVISLIGIIGAVIEHRVVLGIVRTEQSVSLQRRISGAFRNITLRYNGWRRGVVASVVRRMNEVTVHWARLVLGWVTVFGRVYYHGM